MKHNRCQQGAALITAMLLAALITILAATWLARFDSQLRIAQVHRIGTQARWLLRAATDWASMIISEDNPNFDDLTETWTIPIAPIRMTDIAGSEEAFFSGRLEDAQARFNLYALYHFSLPENNTIENATIKQTQVEWAKNLMLKAGLTPEQTQLWIKHLVQLSQSYQKKLNLNPDNMINHIPPSTPVLDFLPPALHSLPDSIKIQLEKLFVWLPENTRVNINTASLIVLQTHPKIGETLAKQIIATLKTAPVRDLNNISNALRIPEAYANDFEISTQYFIATGRVTLGKIDMMARSLLQRSKDTDHQSSPLILWTQSL